MNEQYDRVGEKILLANHKRLFLRCIENGVDAYLLRSDGTMVRDWGDYENNFAHEVEAELFVRRSELSKIDALQRNSLLDPKDKLGWIAGAYIVLFTSLVQWLTSSFVSESANALLSVYGRYLVPGIYTVFEIIIWFKVPRKMRNTIPMNLARALFGTLLIVALLELSS